MNMKEPVDEIVLAKHRSGMAFAVAPSIFGTLCVWINLPAKPHMGINGSIRLVCRYKSRRAFAAWLRKAADQIEAG
jgi:hypothetical protein